MDDSVPSGATPNSPPGLRRASLWSLALNGGRVTTNTLVLLVLAGLLGPVAFGTVAVATIYVLLVQLAFQQGLAPALIARRDVDKDVLDVTFQMATLGATALLLVSLGVSELLGALFADPDLPAVVRVLALLLPLLALDLVPDCLARRRSDFRLLAARANISVVVGGTVGITAALAGWGVWALVAQQLVAAALSTTLLLARTPWRPSLHGTYFWKRWDLCRELLSYSWRASLAATAQFLAVHVDSVIAGLFLGPRAVGLYRLASRIATTLTDLVVRSGQMALLPDLARRRFDPTAAFHQRLLVIQRRSAVLSMPVFGALVGSSFVVLPLLGTEWEPASSTLLLLAVTALVGIVTGAVPPILQAVGKPGALAALNWLSLLLTAGAATAVAVLMESRPLSTQLAGVAGSRLAVVLLLITPVAVLFLRAATGLGGWLYIRASLPGLAVGLVAAAAGLGATAALPDSAGRIASALVVGTVSAVAAALGIAAVERALLFSVLRRVLRREG